MLPSFQQKKIIKFYHSAWCFLTITVTKLLPATIAFLLFTGCSTCIKPGRHSNLTPVSDEVSPISSMIYFYQGPMDHLSSVRFGECPMFPHCSAYALSAIEKHGVLLGWFMTCDRLMRCGRDEIDISPEIIVDGKVKTFDPVDRNDKWFEEN
jgi:uncharacterized protein